MTLISAHTILLAWMLTSMTSWCQAYERELRRYLETEQAVAAIPFSHSVGTLHVETAPLKASLRAEAAAWKAQFAKNLHKKGLDDLQVRFLCRVSHFASSLRLLDLPGRLIIGRLRLLYLNETAHHKPVPGTASFVLIVLSTE